MTNTQILNTINKEIKALTKAFEQHKTSQPKDIREEWLNTIEATHALGISEKSLQRLRSCGSLPFSRVHGRVYYKRQDIQELLERNYYKLKTNHCGCK